MIMHSSNIGQSSFLEAKTFWLGILSPEAISYQEVIGPRAIGQAGGKDV